MHWLFMLAAAFRGPRPKSLGREIMYWSHDQPPQSYAGRARDVDSGDVLLALSVLRAGKQLRAWYGYADCRICGETLGTRDIGVLGFVWPEKAEHYVAEHEVWTPGLSELVKVARFRKAAS